MCCAWKAQRMYVYVVSHRAIRVNPVVWVCLGNLSV